MVGINWLSRLSNALLKGEKLLITILAALLILLILLNIVTRSAGAAIFWVDELAIYTMIWMAFIGTSVMVRMRSGVAVTLVTELLPPHFQRAIARLVDAIVVLFAITLLVLCWQWYEPVALIQSDFDFDEFARNTFKFIYSEPTNTVGIKKFWIWLAVPLMAINMTIHAIANLLEGPADDSTSGAKGKRPLGEA